MALPPKDIDFAQLIAWIKDTTGDSESAIARRIGVSSAAVNNWVHRKRGTGRGPRDENLRRLAAEYGIPEDHVFAAAGRKTPGPVSPDGRERIVALYEQLTAEQQAMMETQMRAVAEGNRSSGS